MAAGQKESYAARNENVKATRLPEENDTTYYRNAKCLRNISNNSKYLLDDSIQCPN